MKTEVYATVVTSYQDVFIRDVKTENEIKKKRNKIDFLPEQFQPFCGSCVAYTLFLDKKRAVWQKCVVVRSTTQHLILFYRIEIISKVRVLLYKDTNESEIVEIKQQKKLNE